jgi:hypothetical protein
MKIMQRRGIFLTLIISASFAIPLIAQAAVYNVSTVAGGGATTCDSTSRPGSTININGAWGISADGLGNVYYVDRSHYVVCKIDSSGNVTRVAGTGSSATGADNIQATSSSLIDPINVISDANGVLYIADYSGCSCIRKVATNGNITTIYNTAHGTAYTGVNGLATSATGAQPMGLALSPSGELYFTYWATPKIMKIDSNGYLRYVAGTGSNANTGDGGLATSADIGQSSSIDFDSAGNLYIGIYASCVRKIETSTGNISTYAGICGSSGTTGDGGAATSALLAGPWDIGFDKADNLYIAQRLGTAVRMVEKSTGYMRTVAGINGSTGALDSTTANSTFSTLYGVVAASNGDLYISDVGNNKIRKVAGLAMMVSPGPPTITFSSIVKFNTPFALTASGGSSGKITFYANGKRIAGCIAKDYTNTVVCNWKPSNRGAVTVFAEVTTSGNTKYRSSDLKISVANRTTTR